MQLGPATAYARSKKPIVLLVVMLQALVTLMKIMWFDIMGALMMGLETVVGFYAVQEDMNLTYIVVWGLLCLINGVKDPLTGMIALVGQVLTFNVASIIWTCAIPCISFAGTFLAYLIYRDATHDTTLDATGFGTIEGMMGGNVDTGIPGLGGMGMGMGSGAYGAMPPPYSAKLGSAEVAQPIGGGLLGQGYQGGPTGNFMGAATNILSQGQGAAANLFSQGQAMYGQGQAMYGQAMSGPGGGAPPPPNFSGQGYRLGPSPGSDPFIRR